MLEIDGARLVGAFTWTGLLGLAEMEAALQEAVTASAVGGG